MGNETALNSIVESQYQTYRSRMSPENFKEHGMIYSVSTEAIIWIDSLELKL